MSQRILVVCDEPVWQQSIRTVLGPPRFELMMVADPVEGLKQAATMNPDLIILDAQLPLLDLNETCQVFRQISRAPLITLMVEGSHRGSIKALTIGADVCLVKPVSGLILRARIQSLLRPAYSHSQGS